jgi:hypothetical protein
MSPLLGWLVGRGIAPHIPVRDASERDDGTFSRSDFGWDSRRGVYICPNNKVLHSTGTVYDGTLLRYRASKLDCDVCPLKMKCCPNTSAQDRYLMTPSPLTHDCLHTNRSRRHSTAIVHPRGARFYFEKYTL